MSYIKKAHRNKTLKARQACPHRGPYAMCHIVQPTLCSATPTQILIKIKMQLMFRIHSNLTY